MQESQISALIEPILTAHGLELDRLDVTPIGKRSVLRVTVDGEGPEGKGPLLDDISRASSRISEALDASAAVGSAPFTLEVSTRGISKPLTELKHFRRNAGRLVKLWLGEEQLTGRIASVTEDGVVVDFDGVERTLALAEIEKAVVQVEMNRSLEQEEEN